MRCEHARQLFDASLDGELSASQVTELSAHRVKCAACRREFALMEVAGRVLSLGDPTARLSDNFTDRLLACVEGPSRKRIPKLQRWILTGVPLAAAAVVAFAALGGFDRAARTRVLGVRVERNTTPPPATEEDWKAIEAALVEDGLKSEVDDSLADPAPIEPGTDSDLFDVPVGDELGDLEHPVDLLQDAKPETSDSPLPEKNGGSGNDAAHSADQNLEEL